MNTPTHIVIGYALLKNHVTRTRDTLWIALGSALPDVAIFILPLYGISTGHTMREVWDTLYFTDSWQNIIDIFNSLPIILFILLASLVYKWRSGVLLACSMCIHVLGDLFLHNDDAHRHLFPLSDYRLISPISYWDPVHYGHWGSFIELCTLSLAALFAWHHIRRKKWKILLCLYWIAFAAMSISRFVYLQ